MKVDNNQTGFSLFELMLAMAIASVLATVLLSISMEYVGSIMRSKFTADLAIESHFALQNIIEDIRLADGVAATNTINDPHAPGGSWTASDANNIFILSTPATTSSNDIIYNPDTGQPYANQIIYFIKDNKLYKRILKNPDAPGNDAETTCPAEMMTSSCPGDRMYSTYIQDISFIYYDINSAVTTNSNLARSVRLSTNLSRKNIW